MSDREIRKEIENTFSKHFNNVRTEFLEEVKYVYIDNIPHCYFTVSYSLIDDIITWHVIMWIGQDLYNICSSGSTIDMALTGVMSRFYEEYKHIINMYNAYKEN